MSAPAPAARPRRSRRALALVVGIIAAVVAVYVAVVVLYAVAGNVSFRGEQAAVPDGAVQLMLSPDDVRANENRISFGLEVADAGALTEDGVSLSEELTVLVPGADGARTVVFPADELGGRESVSFVAEGDIEQWPFDTYRFTSAVIPVRVDADGEAVPVTYALLLGADRVPGWEISARSDVVDTVEGLDGEEVELRTLEFTAKRSNATVAFGIVLLALMVSMPVLVLVAAILVLRRKRHVEATMLGWVAAMLFAAVPLRSFLPGNPPIGSWVDYLIVLWVLAGLVGALVIYLIAWVRDGPVGEAGQPIHLRHRRGDHMP